MTKHIELKTVNQGTALASTLALPPLVIEGLAEFKGSFDRLCLQAGTAAIETMLAADAEQLCGKRYQRHADRQGHRWGMINSEVGWHGGKAAIRRPRVRQRGGAELELSSWTAIQKADLLPRWAFNQMLIGVATRKYARSVRLPDGDLAGQARRATTKSSVSRRFVALSTAKLKEWLAADLSGLDQLVIQIDGLRVGDHVLVAAIGIDGAGDKHVLAVALGATENAAVVKALLADLVERGLQPDIARLFIVDGAKAQAGSTGEARSAGVQGTETHAAKPDIESPAAVGPLMEAVVERNNLKKALAQVKCDKGAAGIDGMTIEDLGPYLKEHWPTIRAQLLDGSHKPQPVRRVEIPKASGGARLLSIPTVLRAGAAGGLGRNILRDQLRLSAGALGTSGVNTGAGVYRVRLS